MQVWAFLNASRYNWEVVKRCIVYLVILVDVLQTLMIMSFDKVYTIFFGILCECFI